MQPVVAAKLSALPGVSVSDHLDGAAIWGMGDFHVGISIVCDIECNGVPLSFLEGGSGKKLIQ